MSREQISVYEIFEEWRYDYVEDLHDISGVCPCGKRGIRYEHHIRNRFTNRQTFVGSKCIELFSKTMKTISAIAMSLRVNGLKDVQCVQINSSSRRVLFSIRRRTKLELHIEDLKMYFRDIPIIQRRGIDDVVLKPHVWVNIPRKRDIQQFEIGLDALYNIRVNVEVVENSLILKMRNFESVPQSVRSRGPRKNSAIKNPFILF